MKGVSGVTGKHLDGLDHLHQSVVDILTTPVGSRVMRRDYGSNLFELVDRPTNRALPVEIYQGVAQALAKWEPRLRLERVRLVDGDRDGRITLEIEAQYLPDGKAIKLEGIVI